MELRHTAIAGGRLSAVLTGEMKMSAGLMNRLKWQNKLLVNGVSRFTDFPVAPGDVITVDLSEPAPEYPPEDAPLTVLYEDAYILAVDKPAGMLIHPSHNCITGTLANRVWGYYQKTGQASAFHPLTRLDRDTFGIVLLAKNSHIHALLQQEKPKKTYHALVLGKPPENQGIISAPIARKPLPSLLREISDTGKPSLTEYTILASGEKLCKLELCPVTGRTHQLRLHCAYMGFPIVGDPQYGTAECMQFGWEHQALCAKRLEFSHPITGEHLCLISQMDVFLP